jgi:hypothetical protein
MPDVRLRPVVRDVRPRGRAVPPSVKKNEERNKKTNTGKKDK